MAFASPSTGGIYAIRNLGDGKLYVGSAVSLERRRKDHFRMLRGGYHANKHLQAAWIKHGETAFVFETLEIVEDRLQLIEREQFYIDFFGACSPGNGYNRRLLAHSNLGMKYCAEAVERNRLAQIGKKASEESKRLTSAALKGRAKTTEHAANIAIAKRGVARPPEMVKRLATKFCQFEKADADRMKELRSAGASYSAIAKEFNCALSTAHRIVNEIGLAYRY